MIKKMAPYSFVKALNVAAVAVFTVFTVSAEAFRYDAHGRRDPFVPLVGQDKAVIPALASVESIDDLRLEGVVMGPRGSRAAMINGTMVREGIRAGNVAVKRIAVRTVTVEIGGKEYILKLLEEGRGEE